MTARASRPRPRRSRSRFAAPALRRAPAATPAGSRSPPSSRSGSSRAARAWSIRCSCRHRRRSSARSGIWPSSGALWHHLSASLLRIGTGWILGTIAGVAVGFAIGLFNHARSIGITFISALFPIPKIALLPLLILWLGIGEEPKIATIALGVFFSTAISVYSGVDAVPRNLIRMAQSFNVPFATIVRRVIWPGALPSILAGFRITASVALLLVVSAEMIGADYGIGAFVLQAGNLMQTDQLLAGVVILSLFGLAVGKLINWLETRLLHWR